MGAPRGNRNAAGPHKRRTGFKSGGKREFFKYMNKRHSKIKKGKYAISYSNGVETRHYY
jgi:hypothetical protein